jgi:general secretion pathway protein D
LRSFLALVLATVALSVSGEVRAADAGKDVFIYQVRQGKASSLGASLSNLLGGQSKAEAVAKDAAGTSLILPSFTPPVETAAPLEPKGAPALPDRAFTIPGASIGGLGDVNISADDTRNVLAIYATQAEYERLERTLAKLDTPQPQVFIEAAIVEVSLTRDTRFGLQYFFQFGNSPSQVVLTPNKTTTVTPQAPGFSYSFAKGTDIQVILNALGTATTVDVLSAPKLMVLNGQTATLGAGARVPIATEQAVDTFSVTTLTNKIQYRDTGVVLTVTPRITNGGRIVLDIVEEVSQPQPTTSSRIDSPTIQQRRVSSTVVLEDGQTVALGGLITEQRSRGKSGIPGLQDVPVLGKLFGESTVGTFRTEHVVLLTARIVDSLAAADAVREGLEKATPGLDPLLAKPR